MRPVNASGGKTNISEVEILGHNGLPSMRLPAVVVHHNGNGAGLMFDVVTGAQRRRLRAWLFDKQPEEKKLVSSLAVA